MITPVIERTLRTTPAIWSNECIMKAALALVLLMLFAARGTLHATSCSNPPPCGRIHSGSILFTGVVVAAKVPGDGHDQAILVDIVRVDEVFEGLATGVEEVSVVSGYLSGRKYLFDVRRRPDGFLESQICGGSGEVGSQYTAEFLDYLRLRKAGKGTTSLNVFVAASDKPAPDMNVTIVGPKGTYSGKTADNGRVNLAGIEPGTYSVMAKRPYFEIDSVKTQDRTVDVLPGACPTAFQWFTAQGVVSGFVRDSKGSPASHLQVELRVANDWRHFGMGEWFSTFTDDSGVFRFTDVLPGSYYLGTNLLGGIRTATIPQAFYPGSRTREGAFPIEVKLGGAVENLTFTLPDFGARRQIRLTVVDEGGRPVPGVEIKDTGEDDPALASIGENLITDEHGRVVINGFEEARYLVNAYLQSKEDFREQTRSSDTLDIRPGKEPVGKTLILNRFPWRVHFPNPR
jgi:hypothetical protein